jgi:hypothetical protein
MTVIQIVINREMEGQKGCSGPIENKVTDQEAGAPRNRLYWLACLDFYSGIIHGA